MTTWAMVGITVVLVFVIIGWALWRQTHPAMTLPSFSAKKWKTALVAIVIALVIAGLVIMAKKRGTFVVHRTTPTAMHAQSDGAVINDDTVTITRPGAYTFGVGAAAPIKIRFKGCYTLDWDTKGDPTDITDQAGRRYIDRPGIRSSDIPGNITALTIKSAGEKSEFFLTATRKGRG